MDLVDPRLGSDYKKEEVTRMIDVALLCANISAAIRPSMSTVVSILEGSAVVPEFASDSSVTNDEMKMKAMWDHFQHDKELKVGDSRTQSRSIDGPLTASSTSAADLYPINMHSDYLEKRA